PHPLETDPVKSGELLSSPSPPSVPKNLLNRCSSSHSTDMTETIASDLSDTQGTGYEPQSTREQVIIEIPNLSGKRSVFDFPKKKRVVTILLVGETGGGKTAFLSLLLNLLHGSGPFELEEKYFKAA
ncbi:unnamed protein product, partial [Rhizoctonia solani]